MSPVELVPAVRQLAGPFADGASAGNVADVDQVGIHQVAEPGRGVHLRNLVETDHEMPAAVQPGEQGVDLLRTQADGPFGIQVDGGGGPAVPPTSWRAPSARN